MNYALDICRGVVDEDFVAGFNSCFDCYGLAEEFLGVGLCEP